MLLIAIRHFSLVFLGGYLLTGAVYGQPAGAIAGKVLDQDQQPIGFASVYILQTQAGTTTDAEGRFMLAGQAPGSYEVQASFLGYQPQTITVEVAADAAAPLTFVLVEKSNQLNEVVVAAKSDAAQVAQSGFNVAVLESSKYQNLHADLNQVLKTTPGVNLRESGGLGSGFNLSLNGLSGNQIRYFIDGVPMENFGSSLSLNNFPINLVDRIEVYKGVVPVHLGADALGGAINIIPSSRYQSYLDATYSFGSFNTHRFSLNARQSNEKTGLFFQANAFFNHSDNNYRMDSVRIWDLELGNLLGYETVERFHNAYTSGMASIQAGLVGKGMADRLTLSFTAAHNHKQYQHPDNNIKRVFGHFHTRNATYLANLHYRKAFGKLELTANASAGQVRESVIDTSARKYNWTGDFIIRADDDPRGELYERRSLFRLSDQLLRSNAGARYRLSPNHSLSVNLLQSHLRRTGEDEVDPLNRSFTTPNTINKYIAGGSYTFETRAEDFQLSAFAKSYWFSGKVVTQDFENRDLVSEPSFNNIGYGLHSRWRISRHLTTKTSFERAYRLPEPYELLGDGIYVYVNPELKPEQSYNFNLGLQGQGQWKRWSLRGEANYFLRASADFIRFLPLGPFGQFENLTNVRSEGVEAGIEVKYAHWLIMSGNITYQDIIDRNEFDEGLPNINYQSRVPNIPYFFANTRLGVQPIEGKEQRLGVFWSTKFVEAFFLNWENLGSPDSKNIIPAQLTHQLDIEYALDDGKYNLSFSVMNLTDARVYDNFSIQLPGRAFYAKFRYFIN